MTKGKSDLGTRAIVAIALIGLAAIALWVGGLGFWLIVAAAALLMMAEWADLSGVSLREKRLAQYALTVPLAIMAPGLAAGPGFLALGLVAGAAFFVAAVTRKGQLAAGVAYSGLPVLALLALREDPSHGLLYTFWAMALVWACDTGAYFAGRAIGGPRLAPQISPNKTWAGFVGGVALAGVFALLLVFGFGLPVVLALATPILAALAQIGDLFESHLKRCAGVKDSGNLLPGHGGLLDRLDGLVAVAPFAALLVLVAT
ncbi:phosphatidate cytidylyltransferase [Sphingomonas psychrotolerans]|uniref:Phosphatidate cytidylyltransferase n=1 Tax=Sphingomonas psychrotolerans TaxID=1327635 RepID=A0A2K8MC91_9SPHN|nr:phosphatidate cytidylyltransferase [Sphingomonas psychrotolerans]ATY31473.1 phosphatidate cytidylyltransferase [Sphingomonas psychrotolerans]